MVKEFASCGVGFIANLHNEFSHDTLKSALMALVSLEHRGGTGADLLAGDGTGIMTDIPHELLGVAPGDAVAHLFLPRNPKTQIQSLRIFEETFGNAGLEVLNYREVPFNASVLSPLVASARPEFLMAFIRRPSQCNSRFTFEKMLYGAKQLTRSRLRQAGVIKQFFFTSLSAGTIVYKGLTRSSELPDLFPDLTNPKFKTRFALFHRRFSTNTSTAWDTAQPFRVVAHNGEINTVSGNRIWAYARERALGLNEDELLTHRGISDSGSVNEMIEALSFRSSIPHPEDILAILMPQADNSHSFYRFWSRAMEPWDGPALFTYSDGRTIGARLDRSGFRPCRWMRTQDHFYLSSEAGSFGVPETTIIEKGSLSGGGSISIVLENGEIRHHDASIARENRNATFDTRLIALSRTPSITGEPVSLETLNLFNYTEEELTRVLHPLIESGKEAVGSMGDSARLAILSNQTRSLFDFFYQCFAQVTNPPLDYLRERIVTDMTVILGRKANIFEPKELVPLKLGIELPGPILTLSQMTALRRMEREKGFEGEWPASITLDTTFPRAQGVKGAHDALESLKKKATEAIKKRISILILSDRAATHENPALPMLLVVRGITRELNEKGMRLRASLVAETAEVKEPHHVGVLTAFGVSALCPYLLLELARRPPESLFKKVTFTGSASERELRLVKGLENGLLKIISKMGISVFQSYMGAELFTILGLSKDLHASFFPRHDSLIGGLGFEEIINLWLKDTSAEPRTTQKSPSGVMHNYLYQENLKTGGIGERHSITLSRTKLVHRMVATETDNDTSRAIYQQYISSDGYQTPISLRHLLRPKLSLTPLPAADVTSTSDILKRFGSGAMSFGAISAESQRDIILAMKAIGGRSNSGEGGENPFYFTDRISAHTKQVASGRFGVTAEYLINGSEIQIKIAQGAKPGEGGQLMAKKVSQDIARARHSEAHVDLISPPPMHDIYSIEDLKQLIYEFRQLKPKTKISVKLVSGENVGTIAVGVAKAGADIIHLSGHDGGTGAASLSSMKHAGLPWETGLLEVHRTLSEHHIRDAVTLRVDGGLFTGTDVIMAAILGAEEFDFGKLLLVAEGCMMARVCEKNTCPKGIATHDPKFKRLYRGSPEEIVRLLNLLAEDVKHHLAIMGVPTIDQLVGRTDLLEIDPLHVELVESKRLDLGYFFKSTPTLSQKRPNPYIEVTSPLNETLSQLFSEASHWDGSTVFPIIPKDRAILATLSGVIAQSTADHRHNGHASSLNDASPMHLSFRGSAGQGFGVFLPPGISVTLTGEANDSVAKSMSGGKVVIVPDPQSQFEANSNTIIGNCALYGATGGTLYVNGTAGNRFGVRNSGATAVVEGVGMHGCEYMTRGTVVILGTAGLNIGAGMTGGVIYLNERFVSRLNTDYIRAEEATSHEKEALRVLLQDYLEHTQSTTAAALLRRWSELGQTLVKCVPKDQMSFALPQSEIDAERPPSLRAERSNPITLR